MTVNQKHQKNAVKSAGERRMYILEKRIRALMRRTKQGKVKISKGRDKLVKKLQDYRAEIGVLQGGR